MISGYTGEAFRTDIFIGPVYYQRLRHMVSDKFQVRLAGGHQKLTIKLIAWFMIIQEQFRPDLVPQF